MKTRQNEYDCGACVTCDGIDSSPSTIWDGVVVVVGPCWLETWLGDYSRGVEKLRYHFIDAHELKREGHPLEAFTRNSLGLQMISVPVIHSFPTYALILKQNTLSDGWSIVFSGDTRPCGELIEAGKGCFLLVHEATFGGDMHHKALKDRHCTMEEALNVSAMMNAQYCVFTHFSNRLHKVLPNVYEAGIREKTFDELILGKSPPRDDIVEGSSSTLMMEGSSSLTSPRDDGLRIDNVFVAFDFMRISVDKRGMEECMNFQNNLRHATIPCDIFPP